MLRFRNTSDARRAGIAFVPESRRSMLFYQEPVYKNISIAVLDRIARLWLKPAVEQDIARRHVEALSIRPPTVETMLQSLSGGNQQKVALAKWLTCRPHAGAERADARHGCRRQGRRGQDRARVCATRASVSW